jgi:hypothetical protein
VSRRRRNDRLAWRVWQLVTGGSKRSIPADLSLAQHAEAAADDLLLGSQCKKSSGGNARNHVMTRKAIARLAGLLYLATLPTAGFSYGYVAFMPQNDPLALVAALQSGRQVLAWTVLLGAAGFIDYLLIAALFHRLFAHTSKLAADLMVLFVAASVPLSLAALAQRMDLMALLDAAPPNLASEALKLLRSEKNLFQLATIFWGLWMMPLGWLAYRSGTVPKAIGKALILGSLGYLSGFVLPLFGVEPPATVAAVLMVVTIGSEFAFMFWLIAKGDWKSELPIVVAA